LFAIGQAQDLSTTKPNASPDIVPFETTRPGEVVHGGCAAVQKPGGGSFGNELPSLSGLVFLPWWPLGGVVP